MSAAAAAPAGSILNWWQTTIDGSATEASVWAQLDNSMQYWTVPASLYDKGYSYLQLEVAGNAAYNYFGWYTPTGSAAVTRNQIFDGAAAAGDFTPAPLNLGSAGDTFGFYLDYHPGNSHLTPPYTPTYAFFTEDTRNGDDDPANTDYRGVSGPVNSWGTTGYRHVRVFNDPRYAAGTGWILAWEDLPGTDAKLSLYGTASTDSASLNWSEGSTATGPDWDYNDMIVAFHYVDEHGNTPTPELGTWLLLSLSLAAVPVLRRRRRS